MRSAAMIAAALAVAVLANGSRAQTADPLAPGAGADSAKSDAAPAAAEAAPAAEKHRERPRHAEGGAIAGDGAQRPLRRHGRTQGRRGGSSDPKKVAGPLAFGRKTVVHLKRVKDCLYDIHAHFADEADTDQTGVDLCKDKDINLTDECRGGRDLEIAATAGVVRPVWNRG